MSLRWSTVLVRRVAVPLLQTSRAIHTRGQLRDNCQCATCVDPTTKQKLVDSPVLNLNIKPRSLTINNAGKLEITWSEEGELHKSEYDPAWLFKYGQSFMHNNFASDNIDVELLTRRPEFELWDRTTIWSKFPEMSYNEMMESESGLKQWLDLFYKYGVAVLRGVPIKKDAIVDVVKRFAYVKETQYGHTFDVINKPVKGSHLAYTGVALAHHTDMNYREKSPGMQLLHCLKYSALWPILCTNREGDVTEVHYNNRTMKPLQAPTHVVTPFYHAYKLFSDKLRDPASCLEFNMVPGDLVAFNNRRVLHGRTAFDATKVDRHLQGCYVDIDEAFSKYDSLRAKFQHKM
ncbi:Gamma-butyrobetaine dioxygenase-like 3 [Homarus americanus]|uniref:Gamma-butyrobetaine dioxygenase-like 3 n=1 Tax=Homarus americanus TaxID=6706 RepID=A0A8J5KD13_HOMAM|nr:Gamma-butyrobetaine dioxygenase-like 3 [Homarus americanus]